MRIFLLCVDALEYDFVAERDFSYLKQKQFFKVEIPTNCMSIFRDENGEEILSPYTPVIWKTIFTGKSPSEPSEAKPPERWKNPLLNWLRSISLARKMYVGLVKIGILKFGLPERLGFERTPLAEPSETFLRMAKRPIIVHNPLASDIRWIAKPLHGGFKPKEIVEDRLKVFMKEKEETLSKLDEDWDLFITYTKLLDIVGHLYWHKSWIVRKYYRMVDRFAGQVQSQLPKDAFMMIISDHGMKPMHGLSVGGEHSHHAFASFSHKIAVPTPLKITDIYDVIVSILNRR